MCAGDYVMNIHLDGGKQYSADISPEELETFLAESDKLDGFTMSDVDAMAQSMPDFIIPVDRIVIWKKGY